jgi:hypothetical protein
MSVRAGTRGATVGRLNPAGEVVVHGVRHPARAEFGTLDPNTPVVVTGSNEFGFLVRAAEVEESVVDSDYVCSTPVEKVEERAGQLDDDLERARAEFRATIFSLLILPFLGGFVFAGVGYWTAGDLGAVIGLFLGVLVGSLALLKLWLAS